jgi:hypothetical protein
METLTVENTIEGVEALDESLVNNITYLLLLDAETTHQRYIALTGQLSSKENPLAVLENKQLQISQKIETMLRGTKNEL